MAQTPVSARVTDLAPGADYCYLAYATNLTGSATVKVASRGAKDVVKQFPLTLKAPGK